MNKLVLATAIALAPASCALTACATVLTPQRCASIDTATVEQIAAVLQVSGIEPVRAAKLAQAVKIGQMAMQAACVAANPAVAQ